MHQPGRRLAERPRHPPSRTTSSRITAAVLGNAFEFYDFTLFASFAVLLSHVFFPAGEGPGALLATLATFGVGFVTRPLGAIVIGAYADRAGRKPAMTLTIWLMALGSALIGVLPGYATAGYASPVLLVAARLLQGFSAGGELGASTTFLVEAVAPSRKGFAGSWQLASQNIGSVVGSLFGFVLAQAMPPDALQGWGWRIPFLFGVLIAPVGIYIRNQLEETLDARSAHGSIGGVLGDLLGRHWRALLVCSLVIVGATVTQYFVTYITTYSIRTLGMTPTVGFGAGLVAGVTGAVFAVAGGLLADRIGFKAVSVWPRVLLTVLVYPAVLYLLHAPTTANLLAVSALVAALQAFSGATAILLIPDAFSPRVRVAGLSIAYAIGTTLFGGTAQLVFEWLIDTTHDPISPIWYVVGTNLLTIAALAVLRPAQPVPAGPAKR